MRLSKGAAFAAWILASATLAPPSLAAKPADIINAATLSTPRTKAYIPTLVKAQVLLDRAHFSPGVVDGANGANTRRAIAAFALAHDVKSTGALNKAVLDALNTDAAPVLASYTISAADVGGPFLAKIPTGDLTAMSKLDALSFTSVREALAEKFHMSEGLLKALNPGVDFKLGGVINVASVESNALPAVTKIEVNTSNNSVSAYDAQNKVVGYFPATVGSMDRPAPYGDWAVRAVAFDPAYYYDPNRLTFGQGADVGILKVASGPNNPVGLVWIDLTKDTYGIHGGPNPEKTGKVSSHGCVRLTNWDAVLLARAVSAGTVVKIVAASGS